MRGYHDELGGPESVASPSEWGALGWGDGVSQPSEETLRHNWLLRRHLENPSYGVVPGDGWRERCLTALGVTFVDDAPPVLVARNRRERGRHLPSSRKPPFGG